MISSFDSLYGWTIGALLPMIAAILYRTYHVTVQPDWLELTRQLGTPFVLGEVAIILYARQYGFDPLIVFRRLDHLHRTLLLLFVATFWISSVFVSQRPSFSIALTVNWVVHLLFAAAVYDRATASATLDAQRVAAGFAAGLGVLTVMTAIHFAFPPHGLTFEGAYDGWASAIPGFISQRLFGAWTGAVLALLLGVAWRQPTRMGNPAWVYPAIALAAGLSVWSGTRAAILGSGVAVAAAWLLDRRAVQRAFWWRAVLAIMVGSACGLSLPPYQDPLFQLFHSASAGDPGGVTSGRITFWMAALHVAIHHPLLGTGAGSCWWLVPVDGFFHVQPHNAIVEFLLIWGVVPTCAIVALLASAIGQTHRVARHVPELLPFVMMLDCLLTISMLDGMLHFSRFIMLIFSLFALCLGRAHAQAASGHHCRPA